MELPIEFFLEWRGIRPLAGGTTPEFARRWAAQTVRRSNARARVGSPGRASLTLSGWRKPELLDTVHLQPDERTASSSASASIVDSLRTRARIVFAFPLPREHADAYYQLVLHPIQAVANLHELYFAAARNRACVAGSCRNQSSRCAARDCYSNADADMFNGESRPRRWQVEPHDGPDPHRLHLSGRSRHAT